MWSCSCIVHMYIYMYVYTLGQVDFHLFLDYPILFSWKSFIWLLQDMFSINIFHFTQKCFDDMHISKTAFTFFVCFGVMYFIKTSIIIHSESDHMFINICIVTNWLKQYMICFFLKRFCVFFVQDKKYSKKCKVF